MPEEIGASAPDVSAPSSDSGANQATGSSPVQDGSGTPSSDASGVTAPVQGASQPSIADLLKDLPAVDELNQQAAQGQKYAAALANLRGVVEPVHTQFEELSGKWKAVEPFQETLSRFERPEQLTESLQLSESLIGWQQGPQGLEPATEKGAALLAEKFPLHADYLAADLLQGMTVDPQTGQQMSRLDAALSGMAQDPAERAKVAKMFGLVEPSSISPQWQPSEEELANVRPELQDIYKKLSYEEREELKLASPEFINSHLQKEKLMQELQTEREQTQQREAQRIQQREEYIKRQAEQAGEQYVTSQLTDALTTFHNSVVEQCNFIQPLDPNNLPQGMTPEQATQMNQQIAQSNKAEASVITGLTVALFNPEVRPFVEPLLREIGVIDEKLIKDLDTAADGFGNNGRNFGHLSYRGKMQANGNGYQPDASITNLNNEASRNLKLMVHIANQVKSRLMEKRSQFFQMKATDHNQTLNNVAASRPSPNGTTFNPATATGVQLPAGKLSKAEIDRLYG